MEHATLEDLDRQLRDAGHRVTRPRRAVWRVLCHADEHLTVDQVHDRVLAGGDDVDLASVYRALALFEELDLARVSRLGDSDAGHWELAHPDEHFHLVCGTCGKVDHHVGTLVSQITHHLDEGHGFEVGEVDLVVTGRCADCRTT
ncbi:transcriptional repressor [Nitriliruptoraceae bacterium ZYF776]|nr:transcriptional repressor [Profundirhabdus halotolerans]